MRWILPVLFIGNFLLLGCGGGAKKANRKMFASVSGKHYLLTNEVSIEGRDIVYGASSYLIKIGQKLYLCTARHLTGEAMGFDPAIDLRTYSDSVNYWKACVRGNVINDTVVTGSLLYHTDDKYDMILLEVKSKPKKIDVLEPEFTKLSKGDKVLILGCEYSNSSCVQNTYFATVNKYTEMDQLEVLVEGQDIELAGFSGAPALDENGKVIGHVLAGGEIGEGKFVIYLAPIYQVKLILENQIRK